MKVLLLLCIVGSSLYVYYWYPIQQAVAISQTIIKQTTPYEQTPAVPKQHILVAGDSTAFGTGAIDGRESVAGRIGSLFPDAAIKNLSENGLRLNGLAARLEREPKGSYDLIVLQIGANDITAFTPTDAVQGSLRSVLDQAVAQADTVVVVTAGNVGLAPVFRAPLAQILSWRTKVVREVFQTTIAEYPTVQYVDLFVTREADVFATDINKYYAADRFHPSGAGYGIWFAAIQPVVEEHFKR